MANIGCQHAFTSLFYLMIAIYLIAAYAHSTRATGRNDIKKPRNQEGGGVGLSSSLVAAST
jgi:hypothetical protein